jgi:hypothetical protein
MHPNPQSRSECAVEQQEIAFDKNMVDIQIVGVIEAVSELKNMIPELAKLNQVERIDGKGSALTAKTLKNCFAAFGDRIQSRAV